MLQFLAHHAQRLRRPTRYLRPPVPPVPPSDNPASIPHLSPELIRHIVDSIEQDDLVPDLASQSWVRNPARESIPYRDLVACSLVSSAFNVPAAERLYRQLVLDVSTNPTLLELEARGGNWRGEFERLSTSIPGLSEYVIDSMFLLPTGSASLVATLENQPNLAALVREVEVIYGPRPADLRAITATSSLVAKVLAACPNVEAVRVASRNSENLKPLESSTILSAIASRSSPSPPPLTEQFRLPRRCRNGGEGARGRDTLADEALSLGVDLGRGDDARHDPSGVSPRDSRPLDVGDDPRGLRGPDGELQDISLDAEPPHLTPDPSTRPHSLPQRSSPRS